jgi:outer membrane protein with beta-barrel domain
MIRYFLFSSILVVLFFPAIAQEKSIEYGFHGGINFNSSHGGSLVNGKSTTAIGYNAGSHIKLRLTSHFAVKGILQYEQIGWAYRSLTFENSSGTGLANGDVTYKLSYLNLPLLAEYEFGQKIKFNSSAGLFFGTLLKNQLITNIEGQATTKSSSKNLSVFNYGVSFGIGTQIPIARKIKLNFDLRNNLGLANLNKSSISSQSTQKTNSLSISSGLSFRL